MVAVLGTIPTRIARTAGRRRASNRKAPAKTALGYPPSGRVVRNPEIVPEKGIIRIFPAIIALAIIVNAVKFLIRHLIAVEDRRRLA